MKEKFAEGDLVVFKGFDPSPETVMVVDRINLKTTKTGRMKGTIDSPFLESISVNFYDSKGNFLTKDVHSHEIVKVGFLAVYHIEKAIEQIDNVKLKNKLKEVLEEL